MITRRFTKHELNRDDLRMAVAKWLLDVQGHAVPLKRISFSGEGFNCTSSVMLEEGVDYGVVEVGPDDVRTSGRARRHEL